MLTVFSRNGPISTDEWITSKKLSVLETTGAAG